MNFYLREINKDDIPKINFWRNDKDLIDLLGNNYLYIGEEVDLAWFDNYLVNRNTMVRLAIIDKELQTLLGTVQLTNIHPINRSAEYSIMIGSKEYWSKGIGSYATEAIIEHGFLNLNLNRIYLTVLDYNERAIRMYEKVGFKNEGLLREALYKNGGFKNLIQMSILKAEKYEERL